MTGDVKLCWLPLVPLLAVPAVAEYNDRRAIRQLIAFNNINIERKLLLMQPIHKANVSRHSEELDCGGIGSV